MSEGGGDRVHWPRVAAALAVGAGAWWAGRALPFPDGAHPDAARAVLFVTALVTSLWLFAAMPIGPAALLPIVLLPLLGVQSTAEVTGVYAHPILWLFGGGFVLAQAIETWGLHRRLAFAVLRLVGPHPRRLVLGFFLAATLISLWINNTSVALMLLPIGTALVERLVHLRTADARTARNFGAGVMVAIAYGASIGGVGTPIGTAPNMLFFQNWQDLVARGAPPVTFLGWTLAFAPFALLFAVVAAVVVTTVALPLARGRLPGADTLLQEAASLPPWTRAERRTALLFGLAVLLWLTRGDIVFGAGDVLHGWASRLVPGRPEFVADAAVAIAVAVALFLVPAGTADGRRLMDWSSTQRLPFDLLFLLGAGMAMANAFEPTGLARAIGEALRPLVGAVHPALLVFVVVLVITLLSEIASNTAIAALFLPLLKGSAIAARIDPLLLMLPATVAASFGFMLPIATPPNTIVFGSRRITFGQMVRAGALLDLLGAALLVPVLWWWAMPLLGARPDAVPAWLPGGGK